MALVDPASQQRAVFDLAWGGALASLKWNGVEYAYGNAPGAMVQPALHHGNPDWNPTLAGWDCPGNVDTKISPSWAGSEVSDGSEASV
jgi:hypothetical protein